MRKITGLTKLIRPANSLMVGFAVIVGAAISARGNISGADIKGLTLGFITAFTLTGASMAINDYYDREIDAINEPSRPIPSGLISPLESIMVFIMLVAIGLTSAFLTNLLCLLLASISLIASVLYSRSGKRMGLPGNMMVSLCVSMPFIYGGACIQDSIEPSTLTFAALAFLANTGREIIKGIVDVEGDKARGVRTLAASHGPKKAAQVALAFFTAAVLLSPIPIALRLMSIWYLPPLIIADAGFISSALSVLRSPTRENAKRAKSTILVWMLLSLIAFLTGSMGQ